MVASILPYLSERRYLKGRWVRWVKTCNISLRDSTHLTSLIREENNFIDKVYSPFTTHYSQFTTIVPERSEWDNNSRLEIVGQGHWGWVAIADTSPRDYLQQNQEQADTRQGSAECAQKIDPIIVQPRQPALVHGFSPAGVLRMLFRLFLTGRAEIDRL